MKITSMEMGAVVHASIIDRIPTVFGKRDKFPFRKKLSIIPFNGLAAGLLRSGATVAAACVLFLQATTLMSIDVSLEIFMAIDAQFYCVGFLGALWGLAWDGKHMQAAMLFQINSVTG